MPQIDLIDPVYYNPNDPYHFHYDNLPLKNIIQRQILINLSLDDVVEQVVNASGSQGTFSNRLNQSIGEDGSLLASAIDQAGHSIEAHIDTANYVRMQKAESDKLSLIADEATKFGVQVVLDDASVVDFDNGFLKFEPSSTVSFSITSPNRLKFNLAFPAEAAHAHHYDQTPVHNNLSTPDYIQYKVNSIASEYIEGSLRVYVNGSRLSATDSVYVPGPLVTDPWTLLTYTPDEENGRFTMSAALDADDVIRIDYDTSII